MDSIIGPQPVDPGSAVNGAVLEAAKRGDVAQVDEAELYHLHKLSRRPTPPECVPAVALADYHWDLVPLEIVHGGDRTEIRWGYRIQDGDAIWTFRTDMELRVVPGSIQNDMSPWRQWGDHR